MDDFRLTDEDAATFDELLDLMLSDAAEDLLGTQLHRAREWKRRRIEVGLSCTLNDLILQVIREPNNRRHVLVAYSAALWRLMGDGDGR